MFLQIRLFTQFSLHQGVSFGEHSKYCVIRDKRDEGEQFIW